MISLLDRRHILAALAVASIPMDAAMAQEEPTLLVAGPPGARLDRWADPLANVVGRAMASHLPLTRRNVGGLDGVTGANSFEAHGEPDGSTALLVPGAATLSWLVGETRAKFDPARWLLLWAATAPAVLVSRARLERGGTLGIATSSPAGPELPFLLALDLAGISPVLTSPGEAQAVLLQGSGLAAAVQAAAARGMNPVLTLGMPGPDGTLGREPLLPGVPSTVEMAQDRASSEMVAAVQAASLAVQLEAGLILPQLTPSGSVAMWRRACQPIMSDPELTAEAARLGGRMLPASQATGTIGRIAGDPGVLLTLRRWLTSRYGWVPG